MSVTPRRRAFGRWLREQRCTHDVTALELSQRLSVHVSYVYNCERGVNFPSFDLLDRWLATLDIDLLARLGIDL